MAGTAKVMNVYTIVEKEGSEKSFWVKVGAGFVNRDGSLSVVLDAHPSNNRLHIRPRDEEPKSSAA